MAQRNRWIDLALPIAILACIAVIYVPLPTAWIDVLLSANLAIAVTLLLTAVFVKSPLELSAFPALLLVLTLGRLALNVATTRLILLRGPIDHELAAGQVVRGFAEFVAGDQIVVGLLIFAILFAVQFLVITKGATRIGEVAARFSLDGLPGRQMAIDADLNAGLITLEQAQQRRSELLQFSDFHGAMDGASKYVRGDAIAGLVITLVNIAGGLALGLYHQMSLEDAAKTFTLLTIGDGLVSQLPALLISISAALLVSRGSQQSDLPRESIGQLFNRPTVLYLTAGFLAMLATTNLPTVPLLTLAAGCGVVAVVMQRRQAATLKPAAISAPGPAREPTLEKLLAGDVLELQLGAALVPLADARQRGTLLNEVSLMRQRLATDLGLVLPKVRIRDNLRLPGRVFHILLHGDTVLSGECHPDRVLAVGHGLESPNRVPCELPWLTRGAWIEPADSEMLPAGNVLPASQAIAESLLWVARKYADELLSRDATAELIEEARKSYPAVTRELADRAVPVARVQHILAQLVREGISIRHLGRILEVIADRADQNSDQEIAEILRLALRRQTSQRLRNDLGVVRAMTLAEDVAGRLTELSRAANRGKSASSPFNSDQAARLKQSIELGIRQMRLSNLTPILIVPSPLRQATAEILHSFFPDLFVVGESEIDDETTVQVLARLNASDLGLADEQAA